MEDSRVMFYFGYKAVAQFKGKTVLEKRVADARAVGERARSTTALLEYVGHRLCVHDFCDSAEETLWSLIIGERTRRVFVAL